MRFSHFKMGENLICPNCTREYELPNRHLTRSDDQDFMVIPRILSCLHTACQSCLEEMRERSRLGKILCPVCKHEDTVKGVKYLPINASALKEVMDATSNQIMRFCNKCYEEVPGFSWCLTCSSSLCEFHHQDHNLTLITKQHEIFTFKELASRKIHIEMKLPPIPCPDVFDGFHNTTIYCHDCMHLISSQSKTTSKTHEHHRTSNTNEIYHEMSKLVDESMIQMNKLMTDLQNKIKSIRQSLTSLDTHTDTAQALLAYTFNNLRNDLNNREISLQKQIHGLVQPIREVLIDELHQISRTVDDCKHVLAFTSCLQRDTCQPDGFAYLVSTSESIELRVDELSEEVKKKHLLTEHVPVLNKASPVIEMKFNENDLNLLSSIISSTGSIISQDNNKNTYVGVNAADGKACENDELGDNFDNSNDLSFLIVSSPLEESVLHKKTAAGRKTLSTACSSVRQLVVVDVRSKHRDKSKTRNSSSASQCKRETHESTHERTHEYDSQSKSSGGKISVHSSAYVSSLLGEEVGEYSENVAGLLGELVGRVEISFEMDQQLFGKYEMRSFYESACRGDGLQVIKVSKTLVPIY